MTRIHQRFWPRRCDDRGTSLVLALVFITVGSLAVMAVLGFADANARSTRLLRDRANEVAAAEAAANIGINNLRKSPYAGTGDCLGTGNTLPLPTFYQRQGGSTDSARVVCELDTSLTTPPFVLPAQGLLTTDASTGFLAPPGNTVTGSGSLRVTGPVHSNSTINLAGGNLTASAITARGACNNVGGSFNPTPTCNNGVQVNVSYTPNVSGLPNRTAPACTGTGVYDLQPGVYTDSTPLNMLTSPACHSGKAIVHLLPGTFYFNFQLATFIPPSIGVWAVTAGTVVAGNTAAGVTLTPGVVPTLPGACKSPVTSGPGWQAPSPTDGVLLVFGGNQSAERHRRRAGRDLRAVLAHGGADRHRRAVDDRHPRCAVHERVPVCSGIDRTGCRRGAGGVLRAGNDDAPQPRGRRGVGQCHRPEVHRRHDRPPVRRLHLTRRGRGSGHGAPAAVPPPDRRPAAGLRVSGVGVLRHRGRRHAAGQGGRHRSHGQHDRRATAGVGVELDHAARPALARR
jgi:hypothetical protein